MGLFDESPGPRSKRAFAEMIVKGLKSAGDQRSVEFCDEPYSLIFDLRTSMRSVNSNNMATWDVTIDEAMEAAKQNLLESDFFLAPLGDKVYASVNGDPYDCCRLPANDIIRNLTLMGDPIAMVRNRDTLFIAGSDDPEGLEIMADLTEKSLEEPRPMMSMALRLDGDKWVDWLPPIDHPSHQAVQVDETPVHAGTV